MSNDEMKELHFPKDDGAKFRCSYMMSGKKCGDEAKYFYGRFTLRCEKHRGKKSKESKF